MINKVPKINNNFDIDELVLGTSTILLFCIDTSTACPLSVTVNEIVFSFKA